MTDVNTTTIGRGVRLTQPVKAITMTVDEYLNKKYNLSRETLDARSVMLLTRIEKYIEEVNPNTLTTMKAVVKAQDGFLNTVTGILESPPNQALLMWDLLMFIAAKYEHEVFNDRVACRFYNELSPERQRAFLSLMTLIISTANVRKRAAALRSIPMSSVTVHLRTDLARTNLAAYYATQM